MSSLKVFLQKWGIHCLLLPVFFILHNYNQYYGLISMNVALETLIRIIAICLIFFVLLWIFIRNFNKCFLLITLYASVVLFFGVLQEFIQLTLKWGFVGRYSVLLPLAVLYAAIFTWIILKKKEHKKITLFLNLLLIIFILTDSAILLYTKHTDSLKKNLLTNNSSMKLDSLSKPPSKPDVYFLVFDSYPGTKFLREYMEFDNSPFNDTLRKNGFFVADDPISNYNRTAFSISSNLNFEYLKNINSHTSILPKQYNQAILTTKYSIVPQIFKHYSYDLYNLSIFEFAGIPPIRKETFLVLPEKSILMYNTLVEKIKREVLWNLAEGRFAIPYFKNYFKKTDEAFKAEETNKLNFNNTVIDSVLRIPLKDKESPKFVYAHLYLPHPPFFYDENGKENDFNYVINEETQKNRQLFLSYLKYTNNVILKITNNIIRQSNNTAIIIVQSDHGFRDFDGGPTVPHTFFKNYMAFYFPDRNYNSLYNTMSTINTFPVVLNKYFNFNIPLMQDTSVFLTY